MVRWKRLWITWLGTGPGSSGRRTIASQASAWALRDLAWSDLQTVEDYVARNADRLSTLSKREALKNAGTIRAGSAS